MRTLRVTCAIHNGKVMDQCDLRMTLPEDKSDFMEVAAQISRKMFTHIGESIYEDEEGNFSLTFWTEKHDSFIAKLSNGKSKVTTVSIPVLWNKVERRKEDVS